MKLPIVVMTTFLLISSVPLAVTAQEPALSFAALARNPDLKPGKDLIVTFALTEGAGPARLRVDFVSIDERAIRVRTPMDFVDASTDLMVEVIPRDDSPVFAEPAHTVLEIPEDRVVRIAGIDSLVNGGSIGAVVGAVPVALYIASYCSDGGCDSETVAPAALGIASGAAIGLGMGLIVDYALKREGKVLYEAPGAGRSLTYSVESIVSRGRKGALFVISW